MNLIRDLHDQGGGRTNVLGWTKRGNCRKSVIGRSVCSEFSPLKIVSLAMQRACLYEEVHLFF